MNYLIICGVIIVAVLAIAVMGFLGYKSFNRSVVAQEERIARLETYIGSQASEQLNKVFDTKKKKVADDEEEEQDGCRSRKRGRLVAAAETAVEDGDDDNLIEPVYDYDSSKNERRE